MPKPKQTRQHNKTINTVLPPEGFVGIQTVRAIFSVGHSTLYHMMAEGRFPRPHKLGRGCNRWEVGELRAHMQKIRSAAFAK